MNTRACIAAPRFLRYHRTSWRPARVSGRTVRWKRPSSSSLSNTPTAAAAHGEPARSLSDRQLPSQTARLPRAYKTQVVCLHERSCAPPPCRFRRSREGRPPCCVAAAIHQSPRIIKLPQRFTTVLEGFSCGAEGFQRRFCRVPRRLSDDRMLVQHRCYPDQRKFFELRIISKK
jgi:hypothetical protein